MVMTWNEFTDLIQTMGQLLYGGFKALDTPIFLLPNGQPFTLLALLLGFLIIEIILDKIIDFITGDED